MPGFEAATHIHVHVHTYTCTCTCTYINFIYNVVYMYTTYLFIYDEVESISPSWVDVVLKRSWTKFGVHNMTGLWDMKGTKTK